MKHIILFLDTSNSDETRVALIIDGKCFEKISTSKILKAQTVLPLIDELMSEHRIIVSDVSEIAIHTGPGSFTGLRVGAAVANALGFFLRVPVNGQQNPVIPLY